MLTVIAIGLLKTLSCFLFEQALHTTVEYDIEDAPYWYYQEGSDEMCTFSYKQGGLESINLAKKDASRLMIIRINDLTEKTAYDNFKNVKNPKEKLLVEAFKYDSDLPLFVKTQLVYSKVKHEDEEQITFVKACIAKESIMTYETQRVETLKKDIMIQKSDTALEELEKEFEEEK
ncbi:MAG: hypothetical protein U9R50_02285 [Campylobacterota bacterium]|nr:hypothetical protein [Campylobacterota bacterium]